MCKRLQVLELLGKPVRDTAISVNMSCSCAPLHCRRLLNLAHVELNAIDLTWDTVARFAHIGLPAAFFDDFAHVADDESRHFGTCT